MMLALRATVSRRSVTTWVRTRRTYATVELFDLEENVPLEVPPGSSEVVLRPYQEACITACTDAISAGHTRIGVSLPTGSGKTTVFVSLLSRLGPTEAHPDATRSLVVVNTIELARQSALVIQTMFPHWNVEVEQGGEKASGKADVTVATYQTLARGMRIHKFDPKFLKAVVVDEAHHAAAPSYRGVLAHFDPAIKHPNPDYVVPLIERPVPIVGFSATFSRHDGIALGSVFSRIVYHRDFVDMIKEEWLCDVRFTSVRANLNLSSVPIGANGDFAPGSLSTVINTQSLNNVVVQSWLDKAEGRKSTLVFCVGLAHVRDLTAAFRGFGIDARYIYADTPTLERKELLEDFKAGLYPVLVNCAILTEGADIPNIDCVVVARPTRSRNVFAQMIGRGMRQSPSTGKADCHIIDFVDSISRVGGVVTAPVLMGLDPNEDVNDLSLSELEDKLEPLVSSGMNAPAADFGLAASSVTYTDYANPFALTENASGAPHINLMSRYAWVGCGGDVYVLDCMTKGYIRVEKQLKEGSKEVEIWAAWYTPQMADRGASKAFKFSRWRKKPILEAIDLSGAIRGCDQYVTRSLFQRPLDQGLLRTAKWRQGPATPGQKVYLKNRWTARGGTPEEAAKVTTMLKGLKKGAAANFITRLKHGAEGRYEKQQKQIQRASQITTKEKMRQEREIVQVGPLRGS